eukprot:4992162-Pyramimonas_sp.AAC.2
MERKRRVRARAVRARGGVASVTPEQHRRFVCRGEMERKSGARKSGCQSIMRFLSPRFATQE